MGQLENNIGVERKNYEFLYRNLHSVGAIYAEKAVARSGYMRHVSQFDQFEILAGHSFSKM